MTAAGDPLRFLWFGSYATGPGYPRSETLIAGLRALGHGVEEIQAPLLSGQGERVSLARGRGAIPMAWRQSKAAASLAKRWFKAGEHDVVVAGYGGLVDVPLLRVLQGFERTAIVWDAFIPLYDTVVRDRELISAKSVSAKGLLALERTSARGADLVLADTSAHRELLARDLRLAREKIAVVPVAQSDPGQIGTAA